MEDRIAQLGNLLFKKSKTDKPVKPPDETATCQQLWSKNSGDIEIDSRLAKNKYVAQDPVSLSEEARKTIAEMKKKSQILLKRENVLKRLNGEYSYSVNTNASLEDNMQGYVDHCKELHSDKEALKKKLHGAQER